MKIDESDKYWQEILMNRTNTDEKGKKLKRQSKPKQILTKMSASWETKKSKDDKEINEGTGTMQNPKPNQRGEGKERNTGNIRVRQRHRKMYLVQLHTAHRYIIRVPHWK